MKQSKKRYGWTEKQIRNHRCKQWRRTAPKWYCRLLNKANKTKTKNSIHKVMLDYDLDLLEFGKTNHRHEAEWLWW